MSLILVQWIRAEYICMHHTRSDNTQNCVFIYIGYYYYIVRGVRQLPSPHQAGVHCGDSSIARICVWTTSGDRNQLGSLSPNFDPKSDPNSGILSSRRCEIFIVAVLNAKLTSDSNVSSSQSGIECRISDPKSLTFMSILLTVQRNNCSFKKHIREYIITEFGDWYPGNREVAETIILPCQLYRIVLSVIWKNTISLRCLDNWAGLLYSFISE